MIEIDPSPAQQLSPEASRMRRSRARRRRGEAVLTLEVGTDLISDLVALGWLSEGERDDKGAVARALSQLAERALRVNVTPSAGSQGYVCFACDLKATTVDTLISLGWLPAEDANDINEIGKAFRHFAGRVMQQHSPGAFAAIAQLLGHKDVRTTIAYYAELDTLSAGRQFDAFLEAERNKARMRGRRV